MLHHLSFIAPRLGLPAQTALHGPFPLVSIFPASWMLRRSRLKQPLVLRNVGQRLMQILPGLFVHSRRERGIKNETTHLINKPRIMKDRYNSAYWLYIQATCITNWYQQAIKLSSAKKILRQYGSAKDIQRPQCCINGHHVARFPRYTR